MSNKGCLAFGGGAKWRPRAFAWMTCFTLAQSSWQNFLTCLMPQRNTWNTLAQHNLRPLCSHHSLWVSKAVCRLTAFGSRQRLISHGFSGLGAMLWPRLSGSAEECWKQHIMKKTYYILWRFRNNIDSNGKGFAQAQYISVLSTKGSVDFDSMFSNGTFTGRPEGQCGHAPSQPQFK